MGFERHVPFSFAVVAVAVAVVESWIGRLAVGLEGTLLHSSGGGSQHIQGNQGRNQGVVDTAHTPLPALVLLLGDRHQGWVVVGYTPVG